jgi:hypothetical protein
MDNENEKIVDVTIDDNKNKLLLNRQPIGKMETPSEKPGVFGNIFGQAFRENEIAGAFKFIRDKANELHYLNDDIPDDFDSFDTRWYEGIPQKYWGYISQGKSPSDIQYRREQALKEKNQDEYYSRGGGISAFIGGTLGYATSPSTILGLLGPLSYAKLGQTFIKTVTRNAPNIALQSAIHEAFVQSGRTDKNLTNYGLSVFADTLFGSAFLGGAAGISRFYKGAELYSLRKTTKYTHSGIDFKYNLDKEGKILGVKAEPVKGSTVGAQMLEDAQNYADTSLAKKGMFKIPGVASAASKIYPALRAANSRFKSISSFGYKLFDSAFEVQAVEKGITPGPNAEMILNDIRAMSKSMQRTMNGLFYEANELVGSTAVKEIKSAIGGLSGKLNYTKDEFGKEVIRVAITKNQSTNNAINTAGEFYSEFQNEIYKRFLEAKDITPDEALLKPMNAKRYASISYDRLAMQKDRQGFYDMVISSLEAQREKIESLKAPINNLKQQIKELGDADKKVKNAYKKKLKKLEKNLLKKIEQEDELRFLLEDKNILTLKERRELRELFKPITDLNDKISDLKIKNSAIKKKIRRRKESALKTKNQKTKERNLQQLKELKAQEKENLKKQKELKEEIKKQQENLDNEAIAGNINSKLFKFNPKTFKVKFRNPDEKIEFRKISEDTAELERLAEDWYETIQGSSDEQISSFILSGFQSELESPIKSRSVFIPHETLLDSGYLQTDVMHAMQHYGNFFGRRIGILEAFGKDGLDMHISTLNQENRDAISEIEKITDKKKREKELLKQAKRFNKAKTFMKEALDVYFGRVNSSNTTRQMAQKAKNLTALTRLGAVPLTQVADLGIIIMKHSLWPTIRDGILPGLKSLSDMAKGKDSEIREYARHAHVGLQQFHNGNLERLYASTSLTEMKANGVIGTGLEKLAHISSNLAGTNYVDNAYHIINAGITQSSVMGMMERFVKGSLSKKDFRQLARWRLDPKELSSRFISQFKKYGYKDEAGGYHSMYHLWDDIEAKLLMARTIRTAVRDTVLQRGIGEAPFWANNPVWSTLLLFKGYPMSAFAKVTVPSMQNPDAMLGLNVAMMIGLGSLVDPLRKISKGQDPDFTEDGWFMSAIENSNFFGIVANFGEEAMSLLNLNVGDRFKNRTLAGTVGGPALGIGEDAYKIIKGIAKGELSHNDANKLARLTPFTQLWYFRGIVNKFVDSLDLKKTPRQKKESRSPW